MSLTLESAKQAGQFAAVLEQLNTTTAMLQAAVDGGASMMDMQCTLAVTGQVMRATIPFSAADTASIFNLLISISQANATAINNQLASM